MFTSFEKVFSLGEKSFTNSWSSQCEKKPAEPRSPRRCWFSRFVLYFAHFALTVSAIGWSAPGISLSEYIVSPKWMLNAFFSARMRLKTPPVFQKGALWPGAALKSVSPVQPNSKVALALALGAVRKVPVSLRLPFLPTKR